MLPIHTATRYVVPLREGGSLPAILDVESGESFVVKFRGAGQGAKALVAEILVGRIAQTLGLKVPDLALVELDESFGRTERDPEIQDLLQFSRGTNVGLRYLCGAFNYDALAAPDIDADLAARIAWLDALVTNIDRTARNPNLMLWRDDLWLIDHGAALFFHHNWPDVDQVRTRAPFAPIKDHVLLPFAGDLFKADSELNHLLNEAVLRAIVTDVPDDLLMDAPPGVVPPFANAEENREAYVDYFTQRLQEPRVWLEAAAQARETARNEQLQPKHSRR